MACYPEASQQPTICQVTIKASNTRSSAFAKWLMPTCLCIKVRNAKTNVFYLFLGRKIDTNNHGPWTLELDNKLFHHDMIITTSQQNTATLSQNHHNNNRNKAKKELELQPQGQEHQQKIRPEYISPST